MSFFDPQNPGIGGIDELTPGEESFLTTFAGSATVGAERTILISIGGVWVASTETWAAPGTNGNVLTSNGTNWISAAPSGSGSVSWGSISGTLSNQTDLQAALDLKVDHATAIAYAVAL